MAFTSFEDPYTHTIAYTLQGFLELHKIMIDDENLKKKLLCITKDICDVLIEKFGLDQNDADEMLLLPGTLSSDWEASSNYCCLTGNAQMAFILLDLFEITREKKYYAAAGNLIIILKKIQKINANNDDPLNGAIPGSY